MSFVITTVIDGVPHGVKTEGTKFSLVPIERASDVYHIMNFPQLSLARSILFGLKTMTPNFPSINSKFPLQPSSDKNI